MTTAAQVAFWVCITLALYPYFGYPVILIVLATFRRRQFGSSPDYLPAVSVLIAARNEEQHIDHKIRETLAWDYPPDRLEVLVASDASEDRTDGILQSLAGPRVRYARMPVRVGKNMALNRLQELATGELLLFCDANSHISPKTVRVLVGHFADARVGCVTGGERTIAEDSEFSLAGGNSAFLQYESFANRLESRLGSVLTCDGALFCIRRELFRELDADLANDLELPIYIGAAGYAVLYEPAAMAFERTSKSPTEEFKRRRRICGQGALAFWRLRYRLRGMRLWQFVSRKVLRWLAVLPMAGILAASIALANRPFFAAVLLLQVGFYSLALLGLAAAILRRPAGSIVDLPFFFTLGIIGAFVGVLDALFGRRYAVWQPITRAQAAVHSTGRQL